MGYYTQYELDTDDSEADKHMAAIAELSDYRHLFSGDTCKWYDHEKDMRAYSENNPSVQFKLSGEGEQSSDIWVKWFKAGKMQTWKLEVNKPTAPPSPW